MTDNFARYPASITELKSERSQNAADWTPRDVLIDTLRDLDSGKISPEALVICWGSTSDGGVSRANYAVSSPNGLMALGVLARTLHRLNENMIDDD